MTWLIDVTSLMISLAMWYPGAACRGRSGYTEHAASTLASLRVTFPPIITVRGTASLLGSSLIPEKRRLSFSGVAQQGRRRVTPGALTVVQRDGVQAGEQLSLVLVDSLHLDVEHGVGIHDQVVVLIQERRELYFVLLRESERQRQREFRGQPRGTEGQRDRHLFNSSDVADEHVVVGELEDLPQLLEVSQEVFADPLQEHK